MVPVTSLWLPILVSAAFVFVVSAIIHMALKYHHSDFKKLPSEDLILEAFRSAGVPPGDYHAPMPADMNMKNPDFVAKRTKGPVVLATVIRGGPPAMGKELVLWFLFCVLVSIFAAYIAGRALATDVEYLTVFRFAGTTAFIGHALAHIPDSIWYKRKWSTTLKNVFDGLVYGAVTGGTFGWLWPR